MRVVLIGERFEASENLALAMLESALFERGHEVVRVGLAPLQQFHRTAYAALKAEPDLIGLSINYQVNALTLLSVAHMLRELGFSGHITAGGAFATLHVDEIMRDAPIDSLILFEGERPLATLADRLSRGDTDLSSIPGLVLRSRSGWSNETPANVWGDAFAVWAARTQRLPEHLGVKSATIIGSRGCRSRCIYCSIGTLCQTAHKHAVRAGHRDAQVGGVNRRPTGDLADEMTFLRRKRGVRLFRFEDDCLLGATEEGARVYVRELHDALTARGVDDVAFTLKLRPDSVTEPLVAELRQLGLIQIFLGLEAMTDRTLHQLGRGYRADVCHRALAALSRHGLPAYFNALILSPWATIESLRADLDALDGITDFPFEVVRLILYGKTPMFRRLRAKGAVSGNYLHWRYTFDDGRVETLSRILSWLPTRRTGAYCVAKQLADLDFNLAVARRLYPDAHVSDIADSAHELTRDANGYTLELVRRIIDLSCANPSLAEQQRLGEKLAVEVGAHDELYTDRIGALLTRLEYAVTESSGHRVTSFLRSGLAAAIACAQLVFVPAFASAADPMDGPVSSTAPADGTGAGTAEPPVEGTTVEGTGSADAGTPEPICAVEVRSDPRPLLRDVASDQCDAYTCSYIVFKVDESGHVTDVSSEGVRWGELTNLQMKCMRSALENVCFPLATRSTLRVGVSGPCD